MGFLTVLLVSFLPAQLDSQLCNAERVAVSTTLITMERFPVGEHADKELTPKDGKNNQLDRKNGVIVLT